MVSETKNLIYQSDESETREKVVEHLIFHKSLLDHQRNGERIQLYIDMIESAGEDEHHHFSEDPFESSIGTVFYLVMEERMNPWEIDLVSFTKLYLDKAKSEDNINFIVAGQLIRMAWSILRMQCEEVLETVNEEKESAEIPDDDFFPPWDMFGYDLYDEPEDIDFEDGLFDSDEPILEKVIRRKDRKPVSLIQLVDAFEEARRESIYREKMERMREERSNERKRAEEERKRNYDSTAHKEDIYRDINIIWERICWYQQDALEFGMIHDCRPTDLITAFVAVLFLHRDGKIKLNQEELPYGQIIMENLAPEDERVDGHLKTIAEKEEILIENYITV